MEISTVELFLRGLDTAMNGGTFGVGNLPLAQIMQTIDGIIQTSPAIAAFKQVLTIVTVFLGLGIVIMLRKRASLNAPMPAEASPLPAAESVSAVPAGPHRNRWNEIMQHMESTRETEWKVAVLDAEKLVDAVLKNAGFSGSSLGERLMALAPGQLTSADGLWFAHKIRNRVAHDVNHFLRYVEARQAIECYRATLEELQAI